ncbi:hypothetical protein FZI85_25060 [Mycobacterium sp. CBMA293]|uniref:hypothetical protein n=1 Tax=unclassified Mycolicibacterium TaxID=2636767 RepID=UPI0012DF88FA|nr:MULTISPECIES: hypothetical protein [unclassified Mycolicibacterium]MUL47587.1 hypothetical protein [Mycolicibacterium sp. CBMA 360]MUL61895.1 hypothetical protein [Mycolicibacterium sp. CBMA 335]MUL68968.1 hypothetical protein [Mycolicibacterium sp. CBMA 311]MUL92815.1 hypothetical protein [Mycolicibacterium sp. CBMA 230]MUM08743.1 hypothetical protein [Mycolicibacterium sp. CBMA 213]
MKTADMTPEDHITEAKSYAGQCDQQAAQTHALIAIAQYLELLVRPEYVDIDHTPALDWPGADL